MRPSTFLLPVAVTAVLLTGGCAGDPAPAGTSQVTGSPATSPSPPGTGHGDGDAQVAAALLAHLEQSVQLAELAERRAETADVRALATRIKGAREPQLVTVRGWVAEGDAATGSADDGLLDAQQLAELAAAQGLDFDRRWLEEMIELTEGGLALASTGLDDGSDPEFTAWCEQLVPQLEADVEELDLRLEGLPG